MQAGSLRLAIQAGGNGPTLNREPHVRWATDEPTNVLIGSDLITLFTS